MHLIKQFMGLVYFFIPKMAFEIEKIKVFKIAFCSLRIKVLFVIAFYYAI